jgi:organic radical activating enzyme
MTGTSIRLADDVREFFAEHRCAFGADNLLPHHLPSDERIRDIVRNVMTVDYAIASAYDVSGYFDYLRKFADDTANACSAIGLPDEVRFTYAAHLEELSEMGGDALARRADAAAHDTMEAFNLFVPKQCNLSCRGCYAAAVPVGRFPYTESLVDGFFAGASAIVAEAKTMGARTVYTSGDGEPTVYPRFFDLLEEFHRAGITWLFFTAGLAFSSEANARSTWAQAQAHLQGPSRDRIASDVARFAAAGDPKPTATALLTELARYADDVEIYHSIWSTDPATNTAYRRPGIDDYDYVVVDSRGTSLALPSSLLWLMREMFTGSRRRSLGIEMPVSDVSAAEIPAMAAFVVDNGLSSYFEPTILTGRNRTGGELGPAPPDATRELGTLLVRKLCGFRNVHQPTVKYLSDGAASGFYVSPGMGVDLRDLAGMGVLEPLAVTADGGFFAAAHSPLTVYANYVHIEGCKCNDFAAELSRDRAGLARRWQAISAQLDGMRATLSDVRERLAGPALATTR